MIYGHSTIEVVTIALCAFVAGAIIGGLIAYLWASLK